MRGALIAILGGLAGFFNIEIDIEDLVDTGLQLMPSVVVVYGGIRAWIGRRDARQRIDRIKIKKGW